MAKKKPVVTDVAANPVGTRGRITADFLESLEADFKLHGPETLERLRRENPAAYTRLAADLLPKQHEFGNTSDAFADMSADELESWLAESFAKSIPQMERIVARAREIAANGKDDDPIVELIDDTRPAA